MERDYIQLLKAFGVYYNFKARFHCVFYNHRVGNSRSVSCHYIDDTLCDPLFEKSFTDSLEACGVLLNHEKHTSGKLVDFLGVAFDFQQKTAKISESTYRKVSSFTPVRRCDFYYVDLSELESFCGRVEYVSFLQKFCAHTKENDVFISMKLPFFF